jgi:hypothetical protein
MGYRDGERDDSALGEYRPDDGEIARVGAALEWIVGEKGITGRHVRTKALNDEVDLAREGAGKDRDAVCLGDKIAPRVADAAGEIEHLVDHRTHRRARQHDRHFVDRRQELSGNDFASYGVGATLHCGQSIRGGGSQLAVSRQYRGHPTYRPIVSARQAAQSLCHYRSRRQASANAGCAARALIVDHQATLAATKIAAAAAVTTPADRPARATPR